MSDEDSDSGPRHRRKRNICCLEDSPSTSSSSPSSPIVTTSRKRTRTRFVIQDDSDSDSGSSIELNPRRGHIPRVCTSDDDSSSGSEIIRRPKRPGCLPCDSESDHGFEGSSQWSSDASDAEQNAANQNAAGAESDCSDGQSEKCPICLISFTNQEIGTPVTCEHMFCIDCLLEWSKNVNTCPVDRKEYQQVLVRRKIGSAVYREIEIQAPNPQLDVDIVEDPTFCEICQRSDREDRMLLCDGCDLGFHLECLDPPLQDIPSGSWFCNDCTPEDAVNRDIELYELQMLLDDAGTWAVPPGFRTRSRLIPRTRQTERVRRRIATNRSINQPSSSSTVSSTSQSATTRRRKPKRKRRKPRYRLAYKVDAATGETVKVKKRVRSRKTKKKKPCKTPKERIATQIGICAPRSAPQMLPDMRIQPPEMNLGSRRYEAAIPSLRLFGDPDEISDFEDEGVGAVVARRGRRRRLKAVALPTVSSSTDILGSILEEQSRFHSKKTKFIIGENGALNVDFSGLVKSAHGSSNDGQSDSVPTSSGQQGNSPPEANQTSDTTGGAADLKDVDLNTPRSGTPASESEIDIYGDIETVSTSKADDFKAPSPLPQATPNSDEENDSEPDMVIDTEKLEETVTSTVDSNTDIPQPTVTSTSEPEIQSQAIQSSSNFEEKKDDDEDSEDGCPNFSIYSKESLNMAKNTDITLKEETTNQVEEVSSSPAPNKPEEQQRKPSSGLYSDSEDETIVKKVDNTFGITDIRNMTEDISEDERSYTPCLDERPVKQGIAGLDTEAISDEDRNDFDESHELKTASDGGDALEINAKESELDFTRPEDYEEGEIVDKSKKKEEEEEEEEEEEKPSEEVAHTPPLKEEPAEANKENENKESPFKKLSKSNKERNYRDKDRERSKSREKKEKDRRADKKKRKEIERYDVRAVVAERPRRLKDKFGRDLRANSPSVRRSLSKGRRSRSESRASSKRRSSSRGRKKRRRSRSRSRSPERRRSRSKAKTKRKRSLSRERRKKSRDRKKRRSRTKSPSPKRRKEWRRHSRDWTPSFSRSRSPEPRHLTPSWTPPRILDSSAVKPHNLTVILTNDAKKKKDKKKKTEKKTKENERAKRKKRERTPPPSKEVFASGDNILVSVSFNKDNETRDVSTTKRKKETVTVVEEVKKPKKDKTKRKKKGKDLSGVKPVAIIDLARSPFKELTPSPKDVIVLSDSENEEAKSQAGICDSSQKADSPSNSYNLGGPKTPPEPQVKFTLAKQTQMRAITNPLHEPEEEEEEEEEDIEPEAEVEDEGHKGPNTPPEPPNSPPSSPDAYDPFEPTKSRSASPEALQTTQSNSNLDDNRDDSINEPRAEAESANAAAASQADKSLTPPLADVQPADSQSSMQATPESSKSPEIATSAAPSQPSVAQTTVSTPTTLAPPRISILSSSLLAATIPQRLVPPTPAKVSPTKAMQRKAASRNQNGSESAEAASLSLDSPYSPGSSDYEDLFEPPTESAVASKPAAVPAKQKTKSPTKVQNAFDALFGGSPFNKAKPKSDKPQAKVNKKPAAAPAKGTKQVGVKLDEDNLKILDELPNSAVEMQVKDKFLKKLNRQERVVEEVKLVLKPHYNKKHINKEEYKDILRRAVPKICHNKSGEINPTKIKHLIEAYVKKVRHSKKVTSSSSVNTQKV